MQSATHRKSERVGGHELLIDDLSFSYGSKLPVFEGMQLGVPAGQNSCRQSSMAHASSIPPAAKHCAPGFGQTP